jgi:GT2 family glycosyltransferase
MVDKHQSVCVLVVTYNRKEYLFKLLRELEKQTYRINKIVIFDNYSNDGTGQQLLDEGYTNTISLCELSQVVRNKIEILYYRNNENTGGSGGFHDGMAIAAKQNCDYIWTMDDDVLPAKNCLEILMSHISYNVRICIPSRTDDNFQDYAITDVNMSNPFKYNIHLRKSRVYNKDILGDSIEIKDMPFEGPLIASSLVNEIGLPKKDLFIIFDDTEYAYRASKVTKLLYVKTAVLHKQIQPGTVQSGLMGWKEYYGYRNQYWFDVTYGKNVFVQKIRPLLSFLELSFRAVVKRRWVNVKILKKAYHDGTKGILGKRVDPAQKLF